MALQLSDLDFGGIAEINNLRDAIQDQQPATLAQLNAAIDGVVVSAATRLIQTQRIMAETFLRGQS